jgi:calcium permeable stress-gated cation channel
MNLMIARQQARPSQFAPMNSAFIQFNTQLAAHMACQSVASHRVMYMSPRYLETAPEDVVWGNMQLSLWQRLIRGYAITFLVAAAVVFYSIPTAFVGTISNITYLTAKLPWLGFINNLPQKLLGIITGLVPSVMISIWLALSPFALRVACQFQGHPTRTVIELAVQKMYFAFLVRIAVAGLI